MESVDAYILDIQQQAKAADGFVAPAMLSDEEQLASIFTGSGDSLAAAMLAEAFSDYRVRALDPQEIGRNPNMVRGNTLYVVSVSGRTVANIRLAELYNTVAITASNTGVLSRAAGCTIPLTFPNSDTLTAGSISFLNSALVCISLVCPVILHHTGSILDRAHQDAAKIYPADTTYFVGNQHTFPVAMYAAAKIYEILGGCAHYTRTEQFAHMELFSVRPGNLVVFFDDTPQVQKMAKALTDMGVNCTMACPHLDDIISDILYAIFYAQALPLNGTGRAGTGRAGISERRDSKWRIDAREVYFMDADDLRGISDAAIY